MGINITFTDVEKFTPEQIEKARELLIAANGELKSEERERVANPPECVNNILPTQIGIDKASLPEWVNTTPAPTAAFGQTPGSPDLTNIPTLGTPAAPPPPPVINTAVELDSAGMPWDGRIHSAQKTKVVDGTWRQRRGVDPAVLASVTAELKAAMNAPAPAVAVPAPAVAVPAPAVAVPAPAVAVPAPPPTVASAAPSAAPAAIIPEAVSAGAAQTASRIEVPTNPTPTEITFPMLMQAITKGFGAGTITQAAVQEAVQSVELTSLPALAARPDLVAAVAARLGVK